MYRLFVAEPIVRSQGGIEANQFRLLGDRQRSSIGLLCELAERIEVALFGGLL